MERALLTLPYLLAILPSILAAVLFTIWALKTIEHRSQVNLWWLLPVEAIRNIGLAYDQLYWMVKQYDARWISGDPAVMLEINWFGKIAVIVGAFSLLYVYIRARDTGEDVEVFRRFKDGRH